jgi:hypothetical protein
MEALRERYRDPEPSAPPALGDLAQRIGKLRWLGMQREAEELNMTLRGIPHTDCVVVIPRDTD